MNELYFCFGIIVVLAGVAFYALDKWREADRMCDMYLRRLNNEIKLKDLYKEHLVKMTAKVDAVINALRGE